MDKKAYAANMILCTKVLSGVTTKFIDVGSSPIVSQYISSLNQGRFVPGTFQCNPVTICKIVRVDDEESYAEVKTSNLTLSASGPVGRKIPWVGLTSLTGYPVDSSSFVAQRSLALTSAYAKMNSPDIFDGGVFLAELAETIAMLRKPLTGIVKLLRSRKFRDPRRLMSAGADTWMEFRYGIRPFASDIAALAALYHKRDTAMNRRFYTMRSGNSISQTFNSATSTGHTVGGLTMYVYYKVWGTAETRVTAGVSYTKKTENPSLMYSLGLSAESLPSILWEKTPLSFVADWFYNTGDWLRAIQPNPYVSCLGGYVSTKTVQELQYVATHCQYTATRGAANARGNVIMHNLTRSGNTALPALPVRTIATISLNRAIDSAILATQRIPSAWQSAIKLGRLAPDILRLRIRR